MKTILSKTLTLAAALVIAATLAVPSPASAQVNTEPVVKNLMSLGLAHPTTGKLLSGALIHPASVAGAALQNTDNVLNSVSVDANMLARLGRGALIAAWGTTGATVNAKDIKLRLGTTTICELIDSTANAQDFLLLAILVESGTNAQTGYCISVVAGAVVAATTKVFTAAVTATAAITVTTTGNDNAAAASAATGKGLAVIPIG